MTVEGEYEPSTSEWVRNQVDEYEQSGGTRGNEMRGVPVVIMTMRGAKSGKVRKTPVMRVESDGVYAVVASKGGDDDNPQWYANLKANPGIDLQDGAARHPMVAREVAGDERDTWWQRAVAVWPDYARYQKRTDRVIPVLVLEPAP